MKDFLCDLPIVCEFMERRPKVAVIRLCGVVAADASMRKGTISHARCAGMIERAFNLRDVREVAVVVNSPGGAPAQCALMAQTIRQCAAEKKVPVTAFVEDVAASGGYWLACAADKIYVQPSSVLGSIGVVSAGFGLEDFIRRYDIKRRLYASGRDKAMLDPFVPEKKADVERLRELQADIHGQFINWVKDRRGARLKGKDGDLFEGQIWTGSGAVSLGIADAAGDLRGVMHEKYGEKVRLIEFEPEKPLVQALMGVKTRNFDFGSEILGAIEDRAWWQRFGL